MLKKLNKNGVNFDSKKKVFISSKRKLISEMDCYNYGELGHLAHQCPKPKKDKYKKKNKDKDDSSDDEKNDKKPFKKKGGKKEYHKKKNGMGYIVGDWLTDIESSCGDSSDDDSDDEKVATIAMMHHHHHHRLHSHLCLMAKGDWKVQSEDESSESDSEFESPYYDELINLLNKYSKIIRKTRVENVKLENENKSLLAKHKSSDELRNQNEIMTTKLKESMINLS